MRFYYTLSYNHTLSSFIFHPTLILFCFVGVFGCFFVCGVVFFGAFKNVNFIINFNYITVIILFCAVLLHCVLHLLNF